MAAAKIDRRTPKALEALLRTLREFGVTRYSDGAISLEFATPPEPRTIGASPAREMEPTEKERRALPTSWEDLIDDDGKAEAEAS